MVQRGVGQVRDGDQRLIEGAQQRERVESGGFQPSPEVWGHGRGGRAMADRIRMPGSPSARKRDVGAGVATRRAPWAFEGVPEVEGFADVREVGGAVPDPFRAIAHHHHDGVRAEPFADQRGARSAPRLARGGLAESLDGAPHRHRIHLDAQEVRGQVGGLRGRGPTGAPSGDRSRRTRHRGERSGFPQNR